LKSDEKQDGRIWRIVAVGENLGSFLKITNEAIIFELLFSTVKSIILILAPSLIFKDGELNLLLICKEQILVTAMALAKLTAQQ
jgi:hypothetical protein